jgi:hypothetical protein
MHGSFVAHCTSLEPILQLLYGQRIRHARNPDEGIDCTNSSQPSPGEVGGGVVAGGVLGAGVVAAGVVAGGVLGAGVVAAGVVAGGLVVATTEMQNKLRSFF